MFFSLFLDADFTKLFFYNVGYFAFFYFHSLSITLFHFSSLFSSFLLSSIIAMVFFYFDISLIASCSHSFIQSSFHFLTSLSTFYSNISNQNKNPCSNSNWQYCSSNSTSTPKVLYWCTYLWFKMIRNFRTHI